MRTNWWELFGDPELNQLETEAAAANPDLKAAAEHYTQARYLTTKAESGLFPQVGLGAGVSQNKSSQEMLYRSPYNPMYGTDETYGAEASWVHAMIFNQPVAVEKSRCCSSNRLPRRNRMKSGAA